MKAIVLLSGGLDSILAAKIVQRQGIEVIPLHCQTPFGHRSNNNSYQRDKLESCVHRNLNAGLMRMVLKEEFLEVIRAPRHGFGSNMNPCIDCKILMLSKTKEIMEKCGAAFVVTGEVLGQRPMSQYRRALETIASKSGLAGLVVRPLCARLLPETIPEQKGWISREQLLAFNGRNRKPQFALAKELGIVEFSQPAGGCLLTDPVFSRRLKDLIKHHGLTGGDVDLLKTGRHFRLGLKSKLIVGRNEQEDSALTVLAAEGDYLFFPDENTAGPTSLGRGSFDADLIQLCCRITASYFDLAPEAETEVIYKIIPEKIERKLKVSAQGRGSFEHMRLG